MQCRLAVALVHNTGDSLLEGTDVLMISWRDLVLLEELQCELAASHSELHH